MRTYTPSGTVPRLYLDILGQPHTLVAGATGSGKSTLIHGLIYTLLYSSPGQRQMILIDPKRVELLKYKRLPHTMIHSSEPRDIIHTLRAAVDFMEKRYKRMVKAGQTLYSGSDVYIIVDEFADLMTTSKKESLPLLCRIAQLGRAARIHLILATQRPTRDIVNGQIKVNIDSRIALRCPTAQDSRNIINVSGAELLPRYGKGIYLTPDTINPVQVDIPLIPDSEINRIINHWK